MQDILRWYISAWIDFKILWRFREDSSNNSDREYSSEVDEESSTLHRLNIFINKIKNLNEPSSLFNDDKELISLGNEVTPNLVLSNKFFYELQGHIG